MMTVTVPRMVAGVRFVVRGWLTLILVVWVAARIDRGLAMAIFKEALKAGWYDRPR